VLEEVIGYRLEEGRYLPITPDEEGRVLSATVGLKISLVEGQVTMEDAETGEILLTSRQLEQRLTEVQQQALQAQQRATRLAERLRALGVNPEEIIEDKDKQKHFALFSMSPYIRHEYRWD
jgi:hypothetical protein